MLSNNHESHMSSFAAMSKIPLSFLNEFYYFFYSLLP